MKIAIIVRAGLSFVVGAIGTLHKVSKKYLPLYVAEFEFRYNNRHNEDIFETAVGGC